MISPDDIDKAFEELSYKRDRRKQPNESRKTQFRLGWLDASQNGSTYSPGTLNDLTWRNLGYRMGLNFGDVNEGEVESTYELLADRFADPKKSARTWIFQGNPQYYDVRAAMKQLEEFNWEVRTYKSDIKIGDVVYIWEAGSDGGLLGSGVVISDVREAAESEAEKQFWVEQPDLESKPRVLIKRTQIFDQLITRDDLKDEPGLSQLSLLRNPRGTNFPVTENEAKILERLTLDRPSIEKSVQRYADENVVFRSVQQGKLYSISGVDSTGFSVERLEADKPHRCTFAAFHRAVEQVKSQGGSVSYHDFSSNTVAEKVGLIQGPGLDMSPDRRNIIDVSDESTLLKHFCRLLSSLGVDQSSGTPKLYKPVMMACLIEAIGTGEISDNQIDFDVLEPRFIEKLNELGQSGGSQQAAFAFFYLASDLFWILSYEDVQSRIEPSRISPKSIRDLVQFASLKDDYWWLLRKHSNRQACLDALATKWWPGATKRMVKFWWVNQGHTYAAEREGGFIWAPKEGNNGRSQYHWENVAKAKEGDIVFNYDSGDIKSISVVTEAGQSHLRPDALEGSSNWNREGWLARLDYHDLESQIPREEVSDGIRKLKTKYGPINKTGGVNQGYLFHLDESSTRIIAEKLDLDSLPHQIAQPLKDLLNSQWSAFVHWGRRFFQTEGIRDEERSYKLKIVERINSAKAALQLGDEDFISALKAAFAGSNNLTHHIQNQKFIEWASEDTTAAQQLLTHLWNEGEDDQEAIARFLTEFPTEVISGAGTRTNMASYLAMARNAFSVPIYKTEPFEFGCRLTGFETPPKPELQVYPHAIRFLDRIISECGERGFKLEDRLDAQSLLFCVTKYDPQESWSEDEKKAFVAWRSGEEADVIVPSGLSELADRLLLNLKCLEEIERLLESKGQVIFYGPPGTGKTYVAREIARYYAEEEGVDIVQFHPSYTYEDFVEGYRPHLHDGQPGFDIVPGPLRLIADKARLNPDRTFVLLIDEINRGNIAKVFGELYFLLEYRDEAISLQYNRSKKFDLPKNLWIIGTMNTADRSIALMDSALRRRFYFYPFFPDEEPISSLLRRWLETNKPEQSWLADVVERVNEMLGDRHGAIGPSYFLRDDLDEDWIATIWKHAILPYLAEQFFGEEERLQDYQLDIVRKSIDKENQGIVDATDSAE